MRDRFRQTNTFLTTPSIFQTLSIELKRQTLQKSNNQIVAKVMLCLVFCLCLISGTSHAQSAYYFKTTEALKLEKQSALEAANVEVSEAITIELNARGKKNEKINQLKTQLNKELKVEDYLAAESLQTEIEKLTTYLASVNKLRKDIESSLKIEDYNKAAEYKSALLNLDKQTVGEQKSPVSYPPPTTAKVPNTKSLQKASTETKPQKFSIGQEYGGGYIFHIDQSGEHGLIAAKTDYHKPIRWGKGRKKTGTISTTNGATNSKTLANLFGDESAAGVCENMVSEGFDDWYLPAIDELLLLYKNKGSVKDLGLVLKARENSSGIKTYQWKNDYISSTEHHKGTGCLGVHFSGKGKQFDFIREEKYRVRAIRKF